MIAELTLTKRCLAPTFVFLIDNFRLQSGEGGLPTAFNSVVRNGGHVDPCKISLLAVRNPACIKYFQLPLAFKPLLKSLGRSILPTFPETLDFDTRLSCNDAPFAYIALQLLPEPFTN